jgi:hypothetical protein
LDKSIERSSAVDWRIAMLGEPGFGFVVHVDSDLTIIETGLDFLETQIDNRPQGGLGKFVEDDLGINTIVRYITNRTYRLRNSGE